MKLNIQSMHTPGLLLATNLIQLANSIGHARSLVTAAYSHAQEIATAEAKHEAADFCGEPYAHNCGRPHCRPSDSYTGPQPPLVRRFFEVDSIAEALASPASDYEDLLAENKRLRGLEPDFPPRPPEGSGLPRYGLRWNGPQLPLSVPMDDGYWTPWHLADQLRHELVAASQQAVATLLTGDPCDERPGFYLSLEDKQRLADLPAGTKLYALPPSSGDAITDTQRLDFILRKCRKVIVERLPNDCLEVYVEEGFMGEVQHPVIAHRGDWAEASADAAAVKRKAIDAAMLWSETDGDAAKDGTA